MMTLCVSAAGALVMVSSGEGGKEARAPIATPPVEFPFEPRRIYPVIASPGRISDIALEPGERLVETKPIAAGDTARWIIGDTSSGEGGLRRVHVLVKPTAGDLSTNLIINTNRRTYFLELRASGSGFLTQVSWRYPPAAPEASRGVEPALVAQPAPRPLFFGYRITGRARFRPERVYDDGARTWLVFGPAIAMGDLPPLYVPGADGKIPELINYRVEGRSLVVDRLIESAELRMGLKKGRASVRITRMRGVGQ